MSDKPPSIVTIRCWRIAPTQSIILMVLLRVPWKGVVSTVWSIWVDEHPAPHEPSIPACARAYGLTCRAETPVSEHPALGVEMPYYETWLYCPTRFTKLEIEPANPVNGLSFEMVTRR